MSCNISPHLQKYIDLIESGERESCNEQKLLIEYVKKVFATEDLQVNEIQIEKYLSYQKYFPFELFPWEVFCFILFACVYKRDGTPRWSDLIALMGFGNSCNYIVGDIS